MTGDIEIAVLGLGYVGLPLAVEFSKKYKVVGFDIDSERIGQLSIGVERTGEISADELALSRAQGLTFTDELNDIARCNVYIVTVPTPIDKYKRPDLHLLIDATRMVASVLNVGDYVIYESTVYPGVTEGECVPELERISGLKFNDDFYVGYSPERINPGDKKHRISNIVKVTSGSTKEAAKFVDELYGQVVLAGTHLAESIKVAEAAKVIENTQRDLNIALVNELAIICNMLGIDTQAVLNAAGTKWNFLPFRPGLVGGHCIGVDPYYLTYKSCLMGYDPEVILAGRRLNDGMGTYVVSQLIKTMLKHQMDVPSSRVLIMGVTFKENCPDLRNSRILDIVRELLDYNVKVDIYDPVACPHEAKAQHAITLLSYPETGAYDAILIAVAHDEFKALGASSIRSFAKKNRVIYDLKYVLDASESDLRL